VTDLVPVERPRAELHLALLLVEREVLHVDRTRALVDGRRNPQHLAVVEDDDVRLVGHLVLSVRTAPTSTDKLIGYVQLRVNYKISTTRRLLDSVHSTDLDFGGIPFSHSSLPSVPHCG